MALPALIVTGASGFVGRHLLESLAEDYRIFGIARRSQLRCGAPVHPNITWFQVDIGEREPLGEVFRMIRLLGGAGTLVHLAAHYDFTGEEHREYQRTNVEGLRNTLDFSRELGVRRFVFSSSVAACRLPAPGSALNEDSPPDGEHIYARTKAVGEAMVKEYAESFPSTIVRFAALFSDWCEYPPLFMFLSTWLSPAWNRSILGGRGDSAIPYLHVKDVVAALRLVLVQGVLHPAIERDDGLGGRAGVGEQVAAVEAQAQVPAQAVPAVRDLDVLARQPAVVSSGAMRPDAPAAAGRAGPLPDETVPRLSHWPGRAGA